MQQERSALAILRRIGALTTGGHVIYKHGKHSRAYFDRSSIGLHTKETSELCWEIAERFAKEEVEVVVAQRVNNILSYEVARHLTSMREREVLSAYVEEEIRSVWHAEKKRECFYVMEKYVVPVHGKYITGKNILVVKDDVRNGRSTRAMIKALRNIGGRVIGVGVLCNRGTVTAADLGSVPRFEALVTVNMEMFSDRECKLHGPCSEGVPICRDFSKKLSLT